jgi:serine/threonine protein kinase
MSMDEHGKPGSKATVTPERRPVPEGAPSFPSAQATVAHHAAGSDVAVPYLPGYEILEKLGEGGMGVVFRARQTRLDRMVAIKVIRADRLGNAAAVQRFRREAQAAARLLHPNVVVIYDANQEGDLHFLSMEYIEGIDLRRFVEQHGPLSWTFACEAIRQAACGLQHASERGLIHRDVKPANLMVTNLGTDLTPYTLAGRATAGEVGNIACGLTVKLLDMGLARVVGGGEGGLSLSTLTHDGSVLGTPDFIAPEQAIDPHSSDIRADLYSLGCTLYYLLTGKPPFPGGTVLEKLDKHRWAEPVPLSSQRDDLPAALIACANRLMAKAPRDRLQTPAELAMILGDLNRVTPSVLGSSPDFGLPPTASSSRSDHAALKHIVVSSPPAAAPASAPNLRSVHPVREWVGHEIPITALAVTADGKRAYVAGGDATVRLWELPTGRDAGRFLAPGQKVGCLALIGDGKFLLVSGAEKEITLWDTRTLAVVRRFVGHSSQVRGLAWFPDGQTILSVSADRTVRQWVVGTGKECRRGDKHTGEICAVAIAPSGRQFATGSWDKSIIVWDSKTGLKLRSLGGPHGDHQWCGVLALAYTPDGRMLLSAGTDDTLWAWHAASGQLAWRGVGHQGWITALAVAPSGSTLAVSASKDKQLYVWDLATGMAVAQLVGHTDAVTQVAWLPDGSIVSAGADKRLILWPNPAGTS